MKLVTMLLSLLMISSVLFTGAHATTSEPPRMSSTAPRVLAHTSLPISVSRPHAPPVTTGSAPIEVHVPAFSPLSALGVKAPSAASAPSVPPHSWSPIDAPTPRIGGLMAYDPDLGGTVLFGGASLSSGILGDTWVYYAANETWVELFLPDSPTPRFFGSMAYDANDHLLVVFGGATQAELSAETWGLNVTGGQPDWHNLTASFPTLDNTPAPRYLDAMAEGPSGNVLMYGGESYVSGGYVEEGDTWTYSLSTGWAEQCLKGSCGPVTPGPRIAASMAYDFSGDVVLFGGDFFGGTSNATWVFNSTGWWNVTYGAPVEPPARDLASMTAVAPGVLLLADGKSPSNSYLTDSYEFNQATGQWSSASTVPFTSASGGAAYDSRVGLGLFYGGFTASILPQSLVWETNGGAWISLTGSRSNVPYFHGKMGLTFDPATGYVLAFSTGINPDFPTTWTYQGGVWTNITPVTITPTNSPSARVCAGMAYDASDNEVLLFGGTQFSTNVIQSDTWAFRSGTWVNVTSSPSPPALVCPAMSRNSQNGGVLLFGGENPSLGLTQETWEYSGGTWSQLNPTNSPSVRDAAAMTYDPAIGGPLLYGGFTTGGTVMDDTWWYDSAGSTWVALCSPTCSNGNPSKFDWPTLGYDPRDNVTVLIGGDLGWGYDFLNGSWTLDYHSLSAPSPRILNSMTWDGSTTDGYLLLFGGENQGQVLTDSWAMGPPFKAPPPTLSRSSADALQQLVVYSASATGGGTTSPTIHWENLPAGCSQVTGPNLNCIPSAPGNYHVFELASSGDGLPSATGNVAPLVVDPPLVVYSIFASRLSLDTGQIDNFSVLVQGGTETYSDNWSGLSGAACTGSNENESCIMVSPGNYFVSENTTDGNGETLGTLPVQVQVFPVPSASPPVFSPSPVISGSTLSVSSLVTNGSGSLVYSWNGLPPGCLGAPAAEFTCIPTTPGTYAISLSVTDSNGGTAQSSVSSLQVLGTPVPLQVSANASVGTGVAPLMVTFAATVTGGDFPLSYQWDFGDGSTGTGAQLTHTYLTPGTFIAVVWANDSAGQSSSYNISIDVHPGPISVEVTSQPAFVLQGQSVKLLGFAQGGTPPYTYTWSGVPAGCIAPATSNFSCQPSQNGNFTVSLTVIDRLGTHGTGETMVSVQSPGVASGSSAGSPGWLPYVILLLSFISVVVGVARLISSRTTTRKTVIGAPLSPPPPPPSLPPPTPPPPK